MLGNSIAEGFTETDMLKHEFLKKLFYFKFGKDYVVPPFNTEKETVEFFKYPSGTKFQNAKKLWILLFKLKNCCQWWQFFMSKNVYKETSYIVFLYIKTTKRKKRKQKN